MVVLSSNSQISKMSQLTHDARCKGLSGFSIIHPNSNYIQCSECMSWMNSDLLEKHLLDFHPFIPEDNDINGSNEFNEMSNKEDMMIEMKIIS